LAWSVKVTDEYASWFTDLIKEDLGDKSGNWQRWYRDNIPLAEQLYFEYTEENEE
jgi:hypothetical protein